MKVKLIHNFKLLPPSYAAITLYPFICFRLSKEARDLVTLRHEMIHVRQIRKVGWFSFYISYLLYYFAGLLRYGDHGAAYYNIPYESEAFNKQYEPFSEMEAEELGI